MRATGTGVSRDVDVTEFFHSEIRSKAIYKEKEIKVFENIRVFKISGERKWHEIMF